MSLVYNIFTFDYEIFGDGSGSIKYCLVDPTDNILELLDQFGVKATFFVDVGLIWAVRENEHRGLMRNLNYSPSQLIEDQLLKINRLGHDIQLHIHPQMIGSIYQNNQFRTNPDHWRITDFPYENTDDPLYSIKGMILFGKKTLEELIGKQSVEYKVIAFRAGGLWSRPEYDLIRVLKEYNFKFDFSTSFNFKIETGLYRVDFTDVFSAPDPLPVGISYYDRDNTSSLITIPIYGARYRYTSEIQKRIFRKIFKKNLKPRWKKSRPKNCVGSASNPGYIPQNHKNYFKRKFETITHNFYLENHSDAMIWCTKDALKRSKKNKRDIYLVGIGHPKAMGDLGQLEEYLIWLRLQPARDRIIFKRVIDLQNHKFN